MVVSVEEVASSLVREYLSRKGLKRTIACMDEEHPRTEASINNRSHLRQILNMESLYRKNKVQASPLKTLLEIIIKHHIEGLTNDKISSENDPLKSALTVSSTANSAVMQLATKMNDTKTDKRAFFISKHTKIRSDVEEIFPSQCSLLPKTDGLSINQMGFCASDSEVQKGQPLMVSVQDTESLIGREPEKKTLVTQSNQRSRTGRIRRGMMTGPIASIPQELSKKRQSRRVEGAELLLRKEAESSQSREGLLEPALHQKSLESGLTEISSADCIGGRWESWSAPERMQSEISFEKVGQNIRKTTKVRTRPIVAGLDMSEMVLDDIDDDNDDLPDLPKVSCQRTIEEHSYAGCPMDQHTAMELKAVLLGSSLNCFSAEWRNQGFTFSETHDLRYGIVQKKGGPCGVLASIQAFVLKKLLFETSENSNTGLQRLRPSNTTRRKCLVLAVAEILWRAGEERQATVSIISGRNHFTPTGHYKSEGVLEKVTCFTVDSIKDVQLLLEQHIEQFETGVLGCILLTISAVLSRSIERIREDMDVPTTTLIGAHGYCTQVGAYLKTPRYPIWVVCSESHFSVLFGLQRGLLTNSEKDLEFDLYYYDGLANQQEEIRLTVSVGKLATSCQDADTDLIPPLEHCIRTRWKDAFVNWNDTEPIL